ncbi:hypothetical protein GQ600_27921 [Phytophthora cactorum]|nr:hypothetical protein GQ600_27921 [Phytophthora cactorum]
MLEDPHREKNEAGARKNARSGGPVQEVEGEGPAAQRHPRKHAGRWDGV